MPTGFPGSGAGRGGYHPITKDDLKQRMKEIEERIKQMDRRERSVGEIRKWLAARKLDYKDLFWMGRQLAPKRAAYAVKSKKPLQPVMKATGPRLPSGKARKGDPEFRRAIHEARLDQKLGIIDVGKKIGVSGASIANWEQGRYVPKEDARVKILRVLNLPSHLGAEATAQMAAANGKGSG